MASRGDTQIEVVKSKPAGASPGMLQYDPSVVLSFAKSVAKKVLCQVDERGKSSMLSLL